MGEALALTECPERVPEPSGRRRAGTWVGTASSSPRAHNSLPLSVPLLGPSQGT